MRLHAIMRRLGAALTLVVTLWLGASSNALAQDASASAEYLIKAGFIYNFANLVEWPAATFAQADSPIVIAILGEDHFGATLDRVLQGKKVKGRPFVIKRFRLLTELMRSAGTLKECQVLYVSSSEMAHANEAIQLAKGLPILTIGEIPGFATSGGIINLVLQDNRVRFEVNVDAAKQAELSVSSRLLALARIVQSAGAEGRKPE